MSEEQENDSPWVLINLDEIPARRQGLPQRLPVPKEEFAGLAEEGLRIEKIRGWVGSFLSKEPSVKVPKWREANADFIQALEAFHSKQALWEKAQAAFVRNDFKKAISPLRMVCNIDKADHAARLNLASAYANTGNLEKAIPLLQEIRPTFEGVADYHFNYGQMLLSTGDQQAVAEEMASVLEADPGHSGALKVLVQLGVLVQVYEDPKDATSLVYLRSDSVAEAVREIWQEAERDDTYFAEQAAYHGSEGRAELALEAAEKALEAAEGADPLGRVGLTRINALRALERHEDALSAVKSALESAPASAVGHVELARSLYDTGDQEGSASALDKALELDPGDQTALFLKFWPKDSKDLERVAACLPALSEFAEKHQGVAGVWRSVARAKVIVGADDAARELFEKAVGLEPENDDLRAEYWQELARQGDSAAVLSDAEALGDIASRDWQLRWQEAEAYRQAGKAVEARGAFSAINMDEDLHVEIRKRAKRAVMQLGQPSLARGAARLLTTGARLLPRPLSRALEATDSVALARRCVKRAGVLSFVFVKPVLEACLRGSVQLACLK